MCLSRVCACWYDNLICHEQTCRPPLITAKGIYCLFCTQKEKKRKILFKGRRHTHVQDWILFDDKITNGYSLAHKVQANAIFIQPHWTTECNSEIQNEIAWNYWRSSLNLCFGLRMCQANSMESKVCFRSNRASHF